MRKSSPTFVTLGMHILLVWLPAISVVCAYFLGYPALLYGAVAAQALLIFASSFYNGRYMVTLWAVSYAVTVLRDPEASAESRKTAKDGLSTLQLSANELFEKTPIRVFHLMAKYWYFVMILVFAPSVVFASIGMYALALAYMIPGLAKCTTIHLVNKLFPK